MLSEKDIYYFLLWKYNFIMKSKIMLLVWSSQGKILILLLRLIIFQCWGYSLPTSMSLCINSMRRKMGRSGREMEKRGGRQSLSLPHHEMKIYTYLKYPEKIMYTNSKPSVFKQEGERWAMPEASMGILLEGETSWRETGGLGLMHQHGKKGGALCQGRLCSLPEVSGSRQQDSELIRIITII